MRPRRSLFFVAPAIPAGSTSCKPPAPAKRLFCFSRITQHGFSLSLRRLQGEQPQARPTGFHESRVTRHESRLFSFLAAFLRVVARHGAAMARHGRPPSPAPATRPVGFHESQVTNHASRPLSPFSSPSVHEGRTTENRRPVTASLFTIVRYCSRLFAIVRHCSLLIKMEGCLNKCPRIVSRSRSASRRVLFSAAPAALPRLHKQGNVFCCVGS